MGNCYSVNSDSKGETMQFGAFNGHMAIAVWKNANGQRPSNVNISQEFYSIIVRTLSEVLKGVPGSAFPIKVKKWDNQIKKFEIALILTFGKDNNGIYYIEFKETDGPVYKFPFLGDRKLEGPIEGGDAERSARMFESFVMFVKQTWHMTALFTRNNLIKPGANKGGFSKPSDNRNAGGNSQYSGSNMASEDDIY
jgi:hypothetical protein